jgi:DNA topoisomerase-1
MRNLGNISAQYRKISEELLSKPELVPNQGKKTDPAHPSIFPTGEVPEKLRGPHQKLYDLIVRRFFSVFGAPALVESMKVRLDVEGQVFYIRGRRVIDEGWLRYYGRYGATEEIVLPPLVKGQQLRVKGTLFEQKETQPPPRYNPASIVKELESRNLGTKATRADIVQILYTRGYIFGNQITVTDLGSRIVSALSEYCPEIVSEELTAQFERKMELIQEDKVSKEEVIKEAREELDAILRKFKQHQLEIGEQLAEAVRITRTKRWVVGKCPQCGGELRILRSRATRKRFIGCSSYPSCVYSTPLPQSGTIVPLHRICNQCNAPMIQVSRSGKRPYQMCINPECPSKKDWKKSAQTV